MASLNQYSQQRDIPSLDGTSCLSPHLHFGEISPRQVWQQLSEYWPTEEIAPFLRQLIWREFNIYLLHHYPHIKNAPFKESFKDFPWQMAQPEILKQWQQGQTGYPIVDAGMRQLWQTGWMHNRVRMVVASFLTKHLRIHWRHGADWFWDTLVDADVANNIAGWQWVAGCGADAAPYFRIFNPVLQSEKFDKDGQYIRRYVPELATLPNKYIHAPWLAPASVLQTANVELGRSYPLPMVDHKSAREQALEAYGLMKSL
jgi:deoxyribodipyrimidine photo-lyase